MKRYLCRKCYRDMEPMGDGFYRCTCCGYQGPPLEFNK